MKILRIALTSLWNGEPVKRTVWCHPSGFTAQLTLFAAATNAFLRYLRCAVARVAGGWRISGAKLGAYRNDPRRSAS